jgi:hypothetical protein
MLVQDERALTLTRTLRPLDQGADAIEQYSPPGTCQISGPVRGKVEITGLITYIKRMSP